MIRGEGGNTSLQAWRNIIKFLVLRQWSRVIVYRFMNV